MRDKVFEIVRSALRELNEELDYETLRDIQEDTPVFGGEEGIDSLSLVSLVANLEHEVGQAFDKPVVLADEKVMSERNTPFRTAGTLTDFITRQLNEDAHAV